jgi:hypothetical protein
VEERRNASLPGYLSWLSPVHWQGTFGRGMSTQRPTCEAGVSSLGSATRIGDSNCELTAQDRHPGLARPLVHGQEACRMMGGDSGPNLS